MLWVRSFIEKIKKVRKKLLKNLVESNICSTFALAIQK